MKDKLFTRSFIYVCIANFMLFFSFYLLMPIFPFYLVENFGTTNSQIGAVLACVIVTVLLVRPFSGYLVDVTSRKPLYLLAYFCIIWVYLGYALATALSLVVIIRLINGMIFGTVSIAGNTLLIDIIPSSRRGEGIGYYGMMNNLSMTFGPMVGVFLHDYYSYNVIFACAIISCAVGLLFALLVKAPAKPRVLEKTVISLDRFILLKGLRAGAALMFLSLPYAITTTFVAMYGKELNVLGGVAWFFTVFAVGLICARFFSGRAVDRGQLTQMITVGTAGTIGAFLLLASAQFFMGYGAIIGSAVYFASALLLGLSYGSIFPAYNTLFVSLAHHNQRGTANATYLNSWDLGVGFGLLLGGYITQHSGYPVAYGLGAACSAVSLVVFTTAVVAHFRKNRIE
ncbi:MAG: MFS transporter [Prevotellaceae bacterium]|jgi:MFS family permease|nr:MFS transporter [Prevotellaceae bacterium]